MLLYAKRRYIKFLISVILDSEHFFVIYRLCSQAQPLVNMYGILWIMWMKDHTNYKCLLTTGQIVIITSCCTCCSECLQARRGMFSHWRSTLQGRVGCARGRYAEASLYRCPVHMEWGQYEGSHTCPYQRDRFLHRQGERQHSQQQLTSTQSCTTAIVWGGAGELPLVSSAGPGQPTRRTQSLQVTALLPTLSTI